MTKKLESNTLLDNAYKLSTPDDNINYYNTFAATYDEDFAEELGYYYPNKIVDIYRNECTSVNIPILDVGCGTGLVAEALKLPQEQIDGVDISTEMMEVADKKQLYRALYKVDLTKSLDSIKNEYCAVLSVGTFTSGHLGPEPLISLLEVARVDALFVIGVRDTFYQKANFETTILDMKERNLIKDFKVVEVPIYEKTEHEHSADKAFALIYRKA